MPEKRLASFYELHTEKATQFMEELNSFAKACGLQQYKTYSRIWEYPWTWSRLNPFKGQNSKVLDIGSEESPFPWYLAAQGFKVIISDVTPKYWRAWQWAGQRLNIAVNKLILDVKDLDLPTNSVDIYLSVSVIEHVPDKAKVIAEAARVLRLGGLMLMTFDICEPNMGMTFPDYNGRALTMCEFDDLFKDSPWFEPGLSELPWNKGDIPEYLSWHRTTAPHHNYVTGAAMVRRNNQPWKGPNWRENLRTLKRRLRTPSSVAIWYIRHDPRAFSYKVARAVISTLKEKLRGIGRMIWHFMMLPLEFCLTSPRSVKFLGEPLFWILGLRRNRHNSDLSRVKRILLVCAAPAIGDMVMATPFLRELRRSLPGVWITLVVKPQIQNLVELCPYVNEILIFDWNVFGRYENLGRNWRALRLAHKHLWPRQFELAVLPRWDFDCCNATFVAFFSGAPLRVAYSENINEYKARLNQGFDRLFTHRLNDNTLKHEVEHNLDIIRFLGGTILDEQLEMWLGPEDESFAKQVMASYKICPSDLLIAFGIGAGEPKRMWPINCFGELGDWMKKKYHARIVIIGGMGEEKLGEELRLLLGDTVIDVVGQTSLRQTTALLKHCRLFVGNDSGPMHLAAAAGVPVIEVSCHSLDGSALHPNSPERFRPWGVPYRLLQPEKALAPCTGSCISDQAHCILGITVEQVKEAVERLL